MLLHHLVELWQFMVSDRYRLQHHTPRHSDCQRDRINDLPEIVVSIALGIVV